MPLPSLRALRAIAETYRTGSLAEAARSLNVSPSAVSHLLRELEQSLGTPLFAGKAQPTAAGQMLGRRLIPAFDTIYTAVGETRRQGGDIRVSALSSFLTLWLVPRLAGFQSSHKDARLFFSTGTRPVELATEPYECAIRWGRGNWPGLDATLLFSDQPVVVVNPLLWRAKGQTIPRLAARTRPDDWPLVAAALGWPDTPPILTFETRALAVQAATAGMGAAVVDRNLVTLMLENGMLVEIAPVQPVSVPEGHWFVALPDRLRTRTVRQFRDWLVAEASGPPGIAAG